MPKNYRNYIGFIGSDIYTDRKNLKGITNSDDLYLENNNTQTIVASGGTTFEPGNGYRYHTFLNPGTFTVTSFGGDPARSIEFLVVAGGGAGGTSQGGGGGAGGIVNGTLAVSPVSTYTITVGNGGASNPGFRLNGSNGGDSKISHPGNANYVLAKGGGGGGCDNPAVPGNPGGSGGGSGGDSVGGTATQPTTPNPLGTNYGFAGGANPPVSPTNGNGGGGAGGVGQNGFSGSNGLGGVGAAFPAFAYPLCFPSSISPTFTDPASFSPSPTSSHYGGGGAGGSRSPHGGPQLGGQGGGGRGTPGPSPTTIYPGKDYLGGGGGGGSSPGPSYANSDAGDGGKGVVIFRYPIN